MRESASCRDRLAALAVGLFSRRDTRTRCRYMYTAQAELSLELQGASLLRISYNGSGLVTKSSAPELFPLASNIPERTESPPFCTSQPFRIRGTQRPSARLVCIYRTERCSTCTYAHLPSLRLQGILRWDGSQSYISDDWAGLGKYANPDCHPSGTIQSHRQRMSSVGTGHFFFGFSKAKHT